MASVMEVLSLGFLALEKSSCISPEMWLGLEACQQPQDFGRASN
jgi:hypothetical protein